MIAKLTLRLDKNTVEKAREYARENHVSLSALIENFLKSLPIEKNGPETEFSPIVKELSGIIELPEDFDMEASYTRYLMEKY